MASIEKNGLRGVFHKRLVGPIQALLLQGANPRDLALSCAVGVAVGSMPILGATTGAGLLLGAVLRLNQPTIQAVNYLMAPVQILLIPVFGYFAAQLGTPIHVDLNPAAMAEQFSKGVVAFLEVYGMLGLRAFGLWAVVSPIYSFFVFRLLHVVFQRFARQKDLK